MADPVTYFQVAGTALYETRDAETVGWAGYVLTSGGELPEQIALAQTLKLGGTFLFAYARPTQVDRDPAGVVSTVVAYLNALPNDNAAILWLRQVEPAVGLGRIDAWGLQWGYVGTRQRYEILTDLNANLGSNLTFSALEGLILTTDDVVGGLNVYIPIGSANFLRFSTQGSEFGIQIRSAGYQQAWIPSTGPNCGCFAFAALITPAETFAPAGGLPPEISYAYRDRTAGRDVVLSYPLLAADDLPESLSTVWAVDPSDPTSALFDPKYLSQGYLRTGCAIADGTPLPSAFRSAEGVRVWLVPLGTGDGDAVPPLGAGSITLASASPAGTAAGAATVYFTLAGRFALTVEGVSPGSAQELLGGLFGSERLSFTSYDPKAGAADTLQYLPGQPAYAPVYPFEAAALENPESGKVQDRLTAVYRAPWATIAAANGHVPQYRAEPEGGALYAPQVGSTATPTILLSAPPQMPVPQGIASTFPLVPYSGAGGGVAGGVLTGFESQILSPTRKKVISSGAKATWQARNALRLAATAVPPKYATTPQGLIARLDGGGSGAYQDVQLAQTTNAAGVLVPFAFGSPTSAVQDALQTNQLFLVAVNAAPWGGSSFASDIYINTGKDPTTGNFDVWKLSALVGQGVSPTSYANVMILKFCSGSLQERVTNPNRWTDPADFSLAAGTDPGSASVAYTGLSQWLQAYIDDGISRASGPSGEFYRDFAQIVQDPLWNGVIVLQASLSADDLPDQIRGLAAGIDFDAFNAHHFGFTISRVLVDQTTGVITMDGNSSVFGLIDYENPAYAANVAAGVSPDTPIPFPTTGGFDFTVLQLQCLFENTRLVDFKSHVQLSADQIFGSRVTGVYVNRAAMPANGVVLDGSYVNQNGTASYVFQQTTPSVFDLDGNVLQALAMNRVQFNTLGARDGGATMLSRFLIWGAFDFQEMRDASGALLDLLSFGSPADAQPGSLGAGLAFSDLAIEMSFPQATPAAKVFSLNTDNLAYDLNASAPRPEGLFAGFGLQLRSFVNATGGTKPADLGFLPVTSAAKLDPLSGPWYGVVYQVTLGGPGALASSAGFTSNLLLGWAPTSRSTDSSRAVFVGLSLPGAAPGAKLFSVQGVFKVGVGSIALLRQEVLGGTGDSFYCLRLDDIGLRIFGIVKLPPSANIQFFLFGDPNNTGSLGWYAAYVADDNPGCGGDTKTTLASATDAIALPAPEATS